MDINEFNLMINTKEVIYLSDNIDLRIERLEENKFHACLLINGSVYYSTTDTNLDQFKLTVLSRLNTYKKEAEYSLNNMLNNYI